MIDLLRQSFTTMLDTLDIVEEHSKTMPYDKQIQSLISFVSAMDKAIKEQLECLEEQAKKFKVQKPD